MRRNAVTTSHTVALAFILPLVSANENKTDMGYVLGWSIPVALVLFASTLYGFCRLANRVPLTKEASNSVTDQESSEEEEADDGSSKPESEDDWDSVYNSDSSNDTCCEPPPPFRPERSRSRRRSLGLKDLVPASLKRTKSAPVTFPEGNKKHAPPRMRSEKNVLSQSFANGTTDPIQNVSPSKMSQQSFTALAEAFVKSFIDSESPQETPAGSVFSGSALSIYDDSSYGDNDVHHQELYEESDEQAFLEVVMGNQDEVEDPRSSLCVNKNMRPIQTFANL